MPDITHAQLLWDEHGQPYSAEFGDVYFSKSHGLEETLHVFLKHNQLPERFTNLPPAGHFVIGETGFGTGRNFLCAWDAFIKAAPADSQLHFISAERYPLSLADLQRALSLWPSLKPLADELLAQYVAIHMGFQRLVFAQGRVVLTLLIGDALATLPSVDARIDAWFLDGFAPAKNPRMWDETLFKEMARLSHSGTTLATYTSAGFVRRGLIAQGFAVKRQDGFGDKHDMLAGQFVGQAPQAAPVWFSRPPVSPSREVIVLGAGLAGASAAASLAKRGWQVRVIDRQSAVAGETSGNLQGITYLKLSAHHTPLSRFVLSGFGYTRRLLNALDPHFWQACGVLQMPTSAQEHNRQAGIAEVFGQTLVREVDQTEASAIAGVTVPSGGMYFPEGGWINPKALCQHLLNHPNIVLELNTAITRIDKPDTHWQLWAGERLVARTEHLVLATAEHVNDLLDLKLSVKPIRGQVTEIDATPASCALNTVLCAEGYVAPPLDGVHTLGASFRFKAPDLTLSVDEHQENLDLLKKLSEPFYTALNADQAPLKGRAGYRCTSPDYLPVVGPVSDAQTFAALYHKLGKDSRLRPTTPCPWIEGLYVTTAHGSRGLISAPLCGEILAAWLNNEPLPVPVELAQACHPNRFALKKVIRRQ